MKYTLQALDENNMTFRKLDKIEADQKLEFVLGLIFWLLALTIGYFAAILLA